MKLRSLISILASTGALALALPAQAHIVFFQGTLAPEAPGATGTGTVTLEYDHDGHTLLMNASWSGLSGTTTVAHIHCCTAAPNTGTAGVALAQSGNLPGFPAGVSTGSYSRLFDLTQTNQYGGGFLTASGGTAAGAEARLIANLESGNAYLNIHTSTFGGGEIRAFFTANAVPEPSGLALVMAAAGLAAAATRRQQVRA